LAIELFGPQSPLATHLLHIKNLRNSFFKEEFKKYLNPIQSLYKYVTALSKHPDASPKISRKLDL